MAGAVALGDTVAAALPAPSIRQIMQVKLYS
ncbi:hypothetical protein SAZ_40180 [Streptomyces noursei ZPM]|nr:hypothetical protein SAZ_40180 [Streptomyces noursei ZPM]EPY93016.1 hypothetical protein K530_50250 [Streptomyces noursei CCRC 11814]